MFEIKDIIEKPNSKNIKNARVYYNQVIDSVFYLLEDIEKAEKELEDKIKHLRRLQTQARLIDQLISDSIINGNNKNNGRKGWPKSKNPTFLYLEELSRLCETIRPVKEAHPKKQAKNRK